MNPSACLLHYFPRHRPGTLASLPGSMQPGWPTHLDRYSHEEFFVKIKMPHCLYDIYHTCECSEDESWDKQAGARGVFYLGGHFNTSQTKKSMLIILHDLALIQANASIDSAGLEFTCLLLPLPARNTAHYLRMTLLSRRRQRALAACLTAHKCDTTLHCSLDVFNCCPICTHDGPRCTHTASGTS